MTLHKKDYPKRTKNKIITPKNQLTQPLYKNKKSTKNNDKKVKYTTDFHKKEQTHTIQPKSKIKLVKTVQQKVHSPLV